MPQVRILSPRCDQKVSPQLTSQPLRKGRFFIEQRFESSQSFDVFLRLLRKTLNCLTTATLRQTIAMLEAANEEGL